MAENGGGRYRNPGVSDRAPAGLALSGPRLTWGS